MGGLPETAAATKRGPPLGPGIDVIRGIGLRLAARARQPRDVAERVGRLGDMVPTDTRGAALVRVANDDAVPKLSGRIADAECQT